MKNIIVPTDFSSASKNAFDTACSLAKIYGCAVKVVHVYAGTFNVNQPFIIRENMGQWEVLNNRLQQFAGDAGSGGVAVMPPPILTEAIEGITETEIIHLSQDADTEMIVMGTTGSHGVSGKIFGTISTDIAKRAHCPVLLVPEEAPYFETFDNILFATNYETTDEATLRQLLRFAEQFGATVHFVHVLQEGQDFSAIESTIIDRLFKNGTPKMAFIISSVMADTVAEGLNDYAIENDIDLVVMVSQNRNFINNMFHKSATRAMAFATSVPLMVMHQDIIIKEEKIKTLPIEDFESTRIKAFEVQQAVVGIERGETDKKLLQYLDFFAKKIPVKAFEFVHFHKEIRLFSSSVQRGMTTESGPVSYIEQLVENLKEEVAACCPNLSHTHSSFQVRRGDPLEGVLKEANYANADLMVIGQKSNVDNHGILAKNMARKAKCNVLIVPENVTIGLENILVPFDFSPYSIKALRTAVAVAKQLAWMPQITALNVFEYPLFGTRFSPPTVSENFVDMVKEDRMQAFKEFIGKYLPDYEQIIGTKFLELENNNTAQGILNFANKSNANLLIMGAKGHSRLERLLLGSVTENLMTINEKWPVLIVK